MYFLEQVALTLPARISVSFRSPSRRLCSKPLLCSPTFSFGALASNVSLDTFASANHFPPKTPPERGSTTRFSPYGFPLETSCDPSLLCCSCTSPLWFSVAKFYFTGVARVRTPFPPLNVHIFVLQSHFCSYSCPLPETCTL